MPRRPLPRLFAAAVLLASLMIGPAVGATRRALIVGINTYDAAGSRSGSSRNTSRGVWHNLSGPVTDARLLRNVLVSSYGFDPGNVHLLLESAATREGILDALRTLLVKPARPDDVCVFYFAGHGSRVTNSRSQEPDGKDETIVPADHADGAYGIRDKDLARIFNDIVDKKAALTAIFDCCHSGSLARGAIPGAPRALPDDPRDIARVLGDETPDPRPPPEQRDGGAVILSAAQDHQYAYEAKDSEGQRHGAFSLALLRSIGNGRRQSVAATHRRIRALMQTTGIVQDPVLAGPKARILAPLFGGVPDGDATHEAVAVLSATRKGTVTLEAGLAAGLTSGSELVSIGADASRDAVRVRVESLDLDRASGRVVKGKSGDLRKGDLLRLDTWAPPEQGALFAWIPERPATDAGIRHAVALATELRTRADIAWIEDPTRTTPTHELSWSGKKWVLLGPGGSERSVGREPGTDDVIAALKRDSGRAVRLFVNLPPSAALLKGLGLDQAGRTSMIRPARSREDAHYVLCGKLRDSTVVHTWVLPAATMGGISQTVLPPRADWLCCDGSREQQSSVARRLYGNLEQLARIRSWIALTPPPDTGYFPYRLALKDAATGQNKTSGSLRSGEKYGVVLERVGQSSPRVINQRYVYAFVLDSHGSSTLLFPPSGSGSVENRVPRVVSGKDAPREIPLGGKFRVGPPYGVDTFVLLTSKRPLPVPEVLFDYAGVRTRSSAATPLLRSDPLAEMVFDLGTLSRGRRRPIKAGRWSVSRLSVQTSEQ